MLLIFVAESRYCYCCWHVQVPKPEEPSGPLISSGASSHPHRPTAHRQLHHPYQPHLTSSTSTGGADTIGSSTSTVVSTMGSVSSVSSSPGSMPTLNQIHQQQQRTPQLETNHHQTLLLVSHNQPPPQAVSQLSQQRHNVQGASLGSDPGSGSVVSGLYSAARGGSGGGGVGGEGGGGTATGGWGVSSAPQPHPRVVYAVYKYMWATGDRKRSLSRLEGFTSMLSGRLKR